MTQVSKIDFGSLYQEDIDFFRNGYRTLFQRAVDKNEETIKLLQEMIPEKDRRKTEVPETTGKKVGHVLKRLLINTGLTFFTSIDPMYLDSGVGSYTRQGRRNMYRATDPLLLDWSICMDSRKGLDAAMALLKPDSETDLVSTLNALEDAYDEMLKAKGNDSDNLQCYAIHWAVLLINNLKVSDLSLYDKIDVIYKKNQSLEMTVNLIKGFKDLHEEYLKRPDTHW